MTRYNQPPPHKDPYSCSICAVYLAESKRVRGEEYCDACLNKAGYHEQ